MRRDGGFATVAVLGLTAVLLAVGALLTTLGTIAVARHRAASAADLAALAGARHVLEGTACAAAARVAALQSAVLEDCVADGTQLTVRVGVPVGPLGTARARARAGSRGADSPGTDWGCRTSSQQPMHCDGT